MLTEQIDRGMKLGTKAANIRPPIFLGDLYFTPNLVDFGLRLLSYKNA